MKIVFFTFSRTDEIPPLSSVVDVGSMMFYWEDSNLDLTTVIIGTNYY
jgi:hypothetical protein